MSKPVYSVISFFVIASCAFAQKSAPTYIPVDVGMFGLGSAGSITVDQTIWDGADTSLDLNDTEFQMQALEIDISASLGLNSIGLEFGGSANRVNVVADYSRFKAVPITVKIDGQENLLKGVANVGVCCRLQFLSTQAALELGLNQASVGLSINVSYLSESLRLGAYGFKDFVPFTLSVDSNGTINTGELKKSLVTAFNGIVGKGAPFKPKLLGLKFLGTDGKTFLKALKESKKMTIARAD